MGENNIWLKGMKEGEFSRLQRNHHGLERAPAFAQMLSATWRAGQLQLHRSERKEKNARHIHRRQPSTERRAIAPSTRMGTPSASLIRATDCNSDPMEGGPALSTSKRYTAASCSSKLQLSRGWPAASRLRLGGARTLAAGDQTKQHVFGTSCQLVRGL